MPCQTGELDINLGRLRVNISDLPLSPLAQMVPSHRIMRVDFRLHCSCHLLPFQWYRGVHEIFCVPLVVPLRFRCVVMLFHLKNSQMNRTQIEVVDMDTTHFLGLSQYVWGFMYPVRWRRKGTLIRSLQPKPRAKTTEVGWPWLRGTGTNSWPRNQCWWLLPIHTLYYFLFFLSIGSGSPVNRVWLRGKLWVPVPLLTSWPRNQTR